MKNSLFFLFLFKTLFLVSQTFPSSCEGDSISKAKYKIEMYRLAVNYTFKHNTTYKDSTRFDTAICNRYYRAFMAMQNATIIPEANLVVNKLGIKALFYPTLTQLKISADSNFLWMKNIRQGIFPCGKSKIDSLLVKYSFVKQNYSTYSFSGLADAFFTSAPNQYNMLAMTNIFGTIPSVTINFGIQYSGHPMIMFDGGNLTDTLTNSYIDFKYNYYWGDCPSGCIFRAQWKFRIHNNCNVEYLGHSGSPLDDDFFTSLEENDASRIFLLVYPNPSKENFMLKLNARKNSSLKILNMHGVIVYQQEFRVTKQEELKLNLPSGTYFGHYTDGINTLTKKIVIGGF